jgi:phosphatidylinositol alpha-mannosyltransferase
MGAVAALAVETSGAALPAAASPDWTLLCPSFLVMALAQPLRALAWRTTLRAPVSLRAVYAASALGSFLDTLLPARLGEASKVAALRVSAGTSWPGLPRAAGSLLCAHLLEAVAFLALGAASAFFLPVPAWATWTMAGGLALSAGGLIAAALLHALAGRFLPASLDRFLASAAAPPRLLARAGAVLLVTWLVRWLGMALLLKAFGVEAGLGAALVYLIVTGLANTAPLLPGNAGLYQGAAMGALALVGEAGATAVAIGLVAPLFASLVTGAAALVGLALCGRRWLEVSRAAFIRA